MYIIKTVQSTKGGKGCLIKTFEKISNQVVYSDKMLNRDLRVSTQYFRFYPKSQKMHQRTFHPSPFKPNQPPKNNQPSNEPKNKPTNIAQTRANLNQGKCEKKNNQKKPTINTAGSQK